MKRYLTNDTNMILESSIWQMEYPTGPSSGVGAVAAGTVQASVVILYTLYGSSLNQNVSDLGCIVV